MAKTALTVAGARATAQRRPAGSLAGVVQPGVVHQPSKGELTLLLHLAKDLLLADSVESVLRTVAQDLPKLAPDTVMLICDSDCGDRCYYMDRLQGKTFMELNHRMCSTVRNLVSRAMQGVPLHAFTLDSGSHIVAPFAAVANGGYIALGWNAPPSLAVQRRALNLLPGIAELAGVRFSVLLRQLRRDEQVDEQCRRFAATQSRHVEELRVSEGEKVEARALAAEDELTGLQNRRGFLAKAEQSLSIARRQQLACAVIFADVDGLKQINDKFGHAAGDQLICDAARIFRGAFRHADVVGRVGGDEFAAFTFDNATPGAIIARINARTAEFNLGRPDGLKMSLSIGVVICDIEGVLPLADYLLRADEEMYRHKRLARGLLDQAS